jgi:predicted TIM-barrel fold metal-dependent hydrolase
MSEFPRTYDIRVRPPFKGFLNCVMYKGAARTRSNAAARQMPLPGALDTLRLEDTLAECRGANVVKALVPARIVGNPMFDGVSNEDVMELVRLQPQLFTAALAVDPFGGRAAAEEVARFAKDPAVVAVVIEPGILEQPRYLDDRGIDPVWDACQSLAMPVLAMGGGLAGPDVGYADPVYLDRVAARFPKLQLLAVHGGWPYVTQILGVAFRRANVHVCPDLYLPYLPGWRDYVDAANTYLQDRFLYGTAYPFADFAAYSRQLMSMPFRKEVLPKVFHDNAERLFGRRKPAS